MAVLDITEQSIISKMLILIFNECPYLPEGITRVEFNNVTEGGIGLIAMQGANKTSEYIDGSYEGQYPFQLVYDSRPSTSSKRIERQNVIDLMGEWAELLEEYPPLDGNRAIYDIRRTSSSNLLYRDEAGNEKYQITMNLLYRKEV